jgi:hypothetical protein
MLGSVAKGGLMFAAFIMLLVVSDAPCGEWGYRWYAGKSEQANEKYWTLVRTFKDQSSCDDSRKLQDASIKDSCVRFHNNLMCPAATVPCKCVAFAKNQKSETPTIVFQKQAWTFEWVNKSGQSAHLNPSEKAVCEKAQEEARGYGFTQITACHVAP